MLKKRLFLLLITACMLSFAACDPYEPTVPTTLAPTQPTAATTVTAVPTTIATEPPAHIHSYFAETVAATCDAGGYMLHSCDCGDAFRDAFTDPLGHDWGDWAIVSQPTESSEGLQERTCRRCGSISQQILEKLEPTHTHDYTQQMIAPTCTQDGYILFLCTCGEQYTQAGDPALGHSWGDWVVVKEPTVDAQGLKSRSCGICGATDSAVIEKLPKPHEHTYTKEKVPATCTHGGYTRYTCQCGDSYEEITSEPKPHTWGNWYVSQMPTTDAEGCRQRKCRVCDAAEQGILEMLTSADSFIFVIWPQTIGRNQEATVIILATPGVTYDIDVYYKSGVSSAKGLDDQVADENGYVIWTWKVGPSTAAGTFKIVVSGGGQEQTVEFTVIVE